MLPDQRAIADALLAEAIESSSLTSGQIDEAMQAIDDLAGSGADWVIEWQRSMLRTGIAEELTKYRARFRRATRTKKGADVEVPSYGGIRRVDDAGEAKYHQLQFANMTIDEFESWARDRRKARDTLSREIQWATDVIELAREMGAKTMGPAIAEFERRHA